MRTAWSARLTADTRLTADWNRDSNAKTNTRVLTTGRTAVASPTAVIAATWSSVLSAGIASADMSPYVRVPVHERDPAQRTDPAQRRGSASAGMGVMNEPVAPVTTSSSTPAWRNMAQSSCGFLKRQRGCQHGASLLAVLPLGAGAPSSQLQKLSRCLMNQLRHTALGRRVEESSAPLSIGVSPGAHGWDRLEPLRPLRSAPRRSLRGLSRARPVLERSRLCLLPVPRTCNHVALM